MRKHKKVTKKFWIWLLPSILHTHRHCTHYIPWTLAFLCDLSMSPLPSSYFNPPSFLPIISAMCSHLHRSCRSTGLNFHPGMITEHPAALELLRPEHEAACYDNDLCVKPQPSVESCMRAGELTRLQTRFHLSYPDICFIIVSIFTSNWGDVWE